MSLVALGSVKGSPGVTTAVAALATRWPEGRRLLVAETDPAGGDLASRLGLAAVPGLVTLAAEGRRDLTPELVWQQAQPLPGSTSSSVLTAPVSAEQASAALSALGQRLGRLLAGLDDVDVLADCGRLDPGSPAMALVRAADLVVLVARPSISQLQHLSARVQALVTGTPVVLLLIGDRPYGVVEAGRAVGAEPLGTIAVDARAADLLASAGVTHFRVLRVSGLLRTARTVAEHLVARLGPLGLPGVAPAPVTPEPAPMVPVPSVPDVAEPEPLPPERPSAWTAEQVEPVRPSRASSEKPAPRRRTSPRQRPLQARPQPVDVGAGSSDQAPVPPSQEPADEPR